MVAAVCVSIEAREQSRALMLDGLDDALKRQVITLFENRLKDREKDPDRMVRGMQNALIAYSRSRAAVIRWSPPICKE